MIIISLNVQRNRSIAELDFSTAVIDAAQSWACRNLDTAESLGDYFDELELADSSITAPINAIATPINNLGRRLYQCPASGGPYDPISPVPPPFSGGQCVGTTYSIEIDVIRNGVPVTFSNTVLGPLGEASYSVDGSVWRGRWFRPDGVGVVWTFDSIGTGFPQPEIVEQRIVAVLAGPDNCGDLDAGQSPPPDLTYDAPDGTPVTEPVAISIGSPVLMADGDIVIPVVVDGPGWSVRVDLPGTGEPRISAPQSPTGEPICCPSEEPDTDVPPGDEPEPPDGDRAIVGAVVVVDTPEVDIKTTQVFVVGGPTMHFPRIGSLLFAVKKGTTLAWLNPVDVQTRRAYIPVPDGGTAVAVVPAPQNGVPLTVTPVYATIQEQADE